MPISPSLRKAFEERFVHPTRSRNFHKDGKILCASEGDEILSFIAEREEEVRRELLNKVENILGSHENPHTLSNCKLCKVQALNQTEV